MKLRGGDSLAASFMASVEECISERECKLYDEGLNSKVKLSLYTCRTFSKNVGFKKYLHGVSDAGSRLLFKFRSGTYGLNEELGRHRGREGKVECTLCGAECQSVVHVLWECPAYSNCRLTFLKKLQELLGDKYSDFDSLNYLEKTSYVLVSELWQDDFSSLLSMEFIVDVWESRKLRLYGENACPGPQPNSSGWDLGQDGKLWNGWNGRSGKLSHSSDVIGACTVGVKKTLRSRSVPFRFTGKERAEKWRPVLPVPFRPFRPFCLLILAPAHAQMNPV